MKGLKRLAVAVAMVGLMAPQAGAQQMTAVTQLGWLRNGEFAPIVIADAKGYFKEEGIEHQIVDGGPGKNPIPIVAVGQAQFGVAAIGTFLVTARLAKDPVDVVAIGTLFQQSPASYISIAAPGSPQPKPKDLEGKTLGIQAGSEFMFHAFAKKNGIDESKVTLVRAQATAEPLMAGKMDFFLGWVVNQTYQIEQEAAKPDAPPAIKGKTWYALRTGEWGVPSYTDVIFATSDTLKTKPELVRRYLNAVQRGMQFVIDHPEEAAEFLATVPGQVENRSKLAWRFKLQNPLFQSADTAKNGLLWMNPTIWDQMIGFLKDGEQIPKTIPASDVMTNEFLPKKAS
jgi:NitT/TauT family transport system substrate-binding protein